MSGFSTLRKGDAVKMGREVESLELTRPGPLMNIRLVPGQSVIVVDVSRDRVRVRTVSMGYETWVNGSAIHR